MLLVVPGTPSASLPVRLRAVVRLVFALLRENGALRRVRLGFGGVRIEIHLGRNARDGCLLAERIVEHRLNDLLARLRFVALFGQQLILRHLQARPACDRRPIGGASRWERES